MPTDCEEIRALIGLLYIAGVLKSSHENVEDLWATDNTAPEIFRLFMSYKRFYLLLRALRFDDATTRNARKAVDKLAPHQRYFRWICSKMPGVLQCWRIRYIRRDVRIVPGSMQLQAIYAQETCKYGIKLFAMVDARMFYTSKLEVYVGTQPNGTFSVDNSPGSVVKRMVQPILNTGRNITIDNWFSSVGLVNELNCSKRFQSYCGCNSKEE